MSLLSLPRLHRYEKESCSNPGFIERISQKLTADASPIKPVTGLRQFPLRGLRKVTGEWIHDIKASHDICIIALGFSLI
jgi:hypothetical protein